MTVKTVTEPPVRVADLLAHGGISRADVELFALTRDWEGEEIIAADAARVLCRRSEIVNAHTSRVRYAWLARDRQAELRTAYAVGVARANVAGLHGAQVQIAQSAAGAKARADYERREPEVGSGLPGADATEFDWFARRFPDEQRAYLAALDANDRETGALLRARS
jgi:hypothetical protein